MAQLIAELGQHLALYRVELNEIKEQDVNAHVMPPEMFERLTENIKKDKRLESLPFVIARGNFFELVSGHHRVRAARAAGLDHLFVLADTRNLTRSQVVAKQIAHNRIFGTDDKETLRRLYIEIESVDDILESYLRVEELDDVRQLEPASIVDISVAVPWKHLTLIFIASTAEALARIEEAVKKAPKHTDEIGVVSTAILDRFRAAALAVGRTSNVRSLGAIITRMTEIVEAHFEQEHAQAGPKDEAPASSQPAQADSGNPAKSENPAPPAAAPAVADGQPERNVGARRRRATV